MGPLPDGLLRQLLLGNVLHHSERRHRQLDGHVEPRVRQESVHRRDEWGGQRRSSDGRVLRLAQPVTDQHPLQQRRWTVGHDRDG